MSKKEKLPSTPETRAQKLEEKKEVRAVFSKTFYIALGVCLSLVLVVCLGKITFFKPKEVVLGAQEETAAAVDFFSDGDSSDSSSDNNSTPVDGNNQNQGTPADNGNGGSSDANSNNGNNAAPGENANTSNTGAISSSSSAAEVVEYFNTAINKVKPNAKQIILVKEENMEAGSVEGNLPGFLKGIAQSAISSNMGVKAENQASSAKEFPVENESWSSKLTADDIEKYQVTDNGSTYTIALAIKADAPSEQTAHGYGHNGKVFSVVMPSVVNDNVPSAAKSVVKDVKTGHKNGMIKVVIDKQTGNVTSASYYFVWTLSLKAAGIDISIPFGLLKEYKISY